MDGLGTSAADVWMTQRLGTLELLDCILRRNSVTLLACGWQFSQIKNHLKQLWASHSMLHKGEYKNVHSITKGWHWPPIQVSKTIGRYTLMSQLPFSEDAHLEYESINLLEAVSVTSMRFETSTRVKTEEPNTVCSGKPYLRRIASSKIGCGEKCYILLNTNMRVQYVPHSLCREKLFDTHSLHKGISAYLERVWNALFWPGMSKTSNTILQLHRPA